MTALDAAMPASCPARASYELRLFHRVAPEQTIDTRQLSGGSITLGRDPETDWVIDDPARVLSRRHCELFVQADGLAIAVTGANGVRAGGELLAPGVRVLLTLPCTLELGDFGMALSVAGGRVADARADPILLASEQVVASGLLLEAFCEGAGLDSSLLTGEEPEDIMRRAGAIYRETVLGVSELMAERDLARSRYEIRRTTIGVADNNLFKWASTPRLAVDLLLSGPAGFLSGPDAVRSSLSAVRRHIVASQAGMRGSLRAVIDRFSPAAIDRAAPEGGSVLKSRAAVQIDEVARRHSEMASQLDDGSGLLDQAYVRAYDAADVAERGRDR